MKSISKYVIIFSILFIISFIIYYIQETYAAATYSLTGVASANWNRVVINVDE